MKSIINKSKRKGCRDKPFKYFKIYYFYLPLFLLLNIIIHIYYLFRNKIGGLIHPCSLLGILTLLDFIENIISNTFCRGNSQSPLYLKLANLKKPNLGLILITQILNLL
jgi:hypothetical protein